MLQLIDAEENENLLTHTVKRVQKCKRMWLAQLAYLCKYTVGSLLLNNN